MYIFCFSVTDVSCENCIGARVCKTSRVQYLNFSRLFNHSLSSGSPCELHSNAGVAPYILNEGTCVMLLSNMNYSIVCPICNHRYNLIYKIPNSANLNIEYCSNAGM